MNSLLSYTKKNSHTKFSSIFKKAWRLGFNKYEIVDNKAQILYRVIQKECFPNANIELLNISLNFMDIIPMIHKKRFHDFINELECLHYSLEDNKWVCWQQHLLSKMEECIEENKTIFIMFDIANYIMHDNEYSTHSTSLIIHNKKVYYINSHGENMQYVDEYVNITKRSKRKSKVQFNKPIDIIFVKRFIQCLNRKLSINMKFKENNKNVYKGPCLQAEDNHGVCFIFPVVLWLNFGINYEKMTNMIHKGKIIECVMKIFGKNHPQLQNLIKKKKNFKEFEDINTILENISYRFIKNVCEQTMSFISQKYFMNKI